jgi:superfamily II DNA or RNA helicase
MISKLLCKSTIEDIRFACGEDWKLIKETSSNSLDITNKDNIVEVVLKLYDTSILEKIAFRELFLKTLSDDKVIELSRKLNISSDNSIITIVRSLAAKPWGSTSKLLKVFKEIGFDKSYLPIDANRFKSTENITVCRALPDLFEYQVEVIERILLQMQVANNKVLLQLPTGSGKTRIMMEAITEYISQESSCYSILWLAHSEELLEQAISSFKNVWSSKGDFSATLHRFYGQYSPNELLLPNSITFAGLQKLSRLDFDSDFFQELQRSVTHIVVDETHKVAAKTYERLVAQLRTNGRSTLIGVTATPGRNYSASSENRKFARFFNDNLITPNLGSDPIKKLQDMGVLSIVKRKAIDTGIDVTDNDLSLTTLKRLGRLKTRNNLLMDEIAIQVEKKRPTLVFSCSTEHSRLLATGLILRGISAAFVDYTKSSSSRRNIIDKFRKGEISVLINYGVLSTGFDAPEIQTLVIARPTTSLILYSQMIGRGLRGPRVGGNKEVTIIDVKDNFSSYGDLDEMYNHFSSYWR